jgi:hypothetical protein
MDVRRAGGRPGPASRPPRRAQVLPAPGTRGWGGEGATMTPGVTAGPASSLPSLSLHGIFPRALSGFFLHHKVIIGFSFLLSA